VPNPRTVLIVFTGYRAGPWACRSLAAAGHRVIGVHPEDEGSGRSSACTRPRPCPSPAKAPDAFVAWLRDLCAEEGVDAVLPMDEDSLRLFAATSPDLGPARVIGPDAAQYAAVCDKGELGRTAAAAGVGHPRSATVGAGGPDAEWPPLPSVVKSRSTEAVGDLEGVVRVATAAARDAAVGRLTEAGHDAVVEELMTGEHWTVHCVRDGEGRFAAVAARIVRTLPRGAGMPSIFEVGPPDGPAVRAARSLIDAIDFRGPCNVQVFAANGDTAVHDVNLRVPASVALAICAGLDMPAAGLEAGLGGDWSAPAPAAPGLRYVSLVDELRALAHGSNGDGGPSRGRVARDILSATTSRRAVVDPPLSDLFWVPQTLSAAARPRVRRLLGRGG
jgi:predicted ATP-grasp superfamily ATP-dependent carboligase